MFALGLAARYTAQPWYRLCAIRLEGVHHHWCTPTRIKWLWVVAWASFAAGFVTAWL